MPNDDREDLVEEVEIPTVDKCFKKAAIALSRMDGYNQFSGSDYWAQRAQAHTSMAQALIWKELSDGMRAAFAAATGADMGFDVDP